MGNFMNAFKIIIQGIARFMYWIAGLALTAIMLLTVADVFLRIFKRPIPGTYELVSLMGALVIGFAIPQTSLDRGQVLMDFLTGKLPFSLQWLFHFITRWLGIIIFAIVGWNLFGMGNDFRASGQVSLTLKLPEYPFAYAIGLCCFVECLVLLTDLSRKKGGEV